MRDDPHLVFGRDEDVLGGAEVSPLAQKFAVGIENLDAVILPVADVNRAFGIHGNRMRRVEFTGPGAALAPVENVFSLVRKLHHARISVAIGDIELAGGSESDVRRPVEGLAVGARFPFDTPFAQQLPLVGKFHYLVIAVVRDPDVILLVDAEAMRIAE